MADMTQLTGAYAASWLPWIMIPMVFYILPFPVFAIVFLWIEREGTNNLETEQGSSPQGDDSFPQPQPSIMGVEPSSAT